MPRLLPIVLLLALVAFGQGARKTTTHPDYVPNGKTAERIAEAVLIGQFGEQRVDAQLPLRAVSTSNDLWLVQGTLHGSNGPGGNFGVWINKHDGCVRVMEHMK